MMTMKLANRISGKDCIGKTIVEAEFVSGIIILFKFSDGTFFLAESDYCDECNGAIYSKGEVSTRDARLYGLADPAAIDAAEEAELRRLVLVEKSRKHETIIVDRKQYEALWEMCRKHGFNFNPGV